MFCARGLFCVTSRRLRIGLGNVFFSRHAFVACVVVAVCSAANTREHSFACLCFIDFAAGHLKFRPFLDSFLLVSCFLTLVRLLLFWKFFFVSLVPIFLSYTVSVFLYSFFLCSLVGSFRRYAQTNVFEFVGGFIFCVLALPRLFRTLSYW